MDETEKIKIRYQKRKNDGLTQKNAASSLFSTYVVEEREKVYRQILTDYFNDFNNLQFLEIGAGGGSNIHFFLKQGIQSTNVYANELLEDRMGMLKRNLPEITTYPGDALKINEESKFDIVFQATVFTSILDDSFKKKLATKLLSLTKENGIILWYDFIYNNPKNKDVKGVSKKEIKMLFKQAKKISFKKVTVAPPIGRKIGSLYPFFNFLFPFLRTHVIAIIEK